MTKRLFVNRLIHSTALVAGILATCTSLSWSANFYKYKDKKGNWVITSSLPQEFSQTGYQVINEKGRTVKVVEAYKDISGKRSKKKQEEERKKWIAFELPEDEKKLILLKTFTDTADIIRARETQISAIQLHIDISKTNISRLEKHLIQAQTKAANLERSGQTVAQHINDQIIDLQRQVRDAQEFVEKKLDKQNRIRKRFSEDITNFHIIFARKLLASWENRSGTLEKANPIAFSCDQEANDCAMAWNSAKQFFSTTLQQDIELSNQAIVLSKIDNDKPNKCLWLARLPDEYRSKEYFLVSDSCSNNARLPKATCPENKAVCVATDIKKHLSNI